ncbi:MAG: hypothetical protein GF317_13285, partial [Candidatus Lokiarchaeota archaeon]|nr:hypothetical protein [Candidatus Lokiarchaeota archaeon]MBD3200610.1 hypothetical protein [Candidatus Lokiarchaeota archaeon]
MKLNQINNSLNYLPAILIIALFSLSMILPLSSENTDFQQSNIRLSAEKSNSEILQDILIAKINEYEEQDYFTQYHYPSIQATYYALYILDALDSLDDINQFSLRDFLMESYDNSSGFFLDQFAKRYLDTDFCIKYYPLSSLLLTTCYAVLSLEIINFTNAINIQTTIDFILSCYDSNTGGFCGRPIETGLHEYFLTPTLDNTYFAVATLELLLDSWNEFSDLKNEVIAFVNGLQLDNVYSFIDGSFYNDENSEFESLSCDEPNILSSYYGIKTLEIFDMEDSIRIDDFHMFLDNLYDDQNKFYRYSNFFVPYNNFANVPGNALVLELANITQYPTINETMVLDFLMENRNELGLWK